MTLLLGSSWSSLHTMRVQKIGHPTTLHRSIHEVTDLDCRDGDESSTVSETAPGTPFGKARSDAQLRACPAGIGFGKAAELPRKWKGDGFRGLSKSSDPGTSLIILAFNLWLVPVDANVRGAAMALCGGFQDFSFEGGVAENAPIILQPASFGQDAWVTDCGGTTTNGTIQDDYLQRYYGVRYNASVKNRIKSATGDDYHKLRMKNVLQFAYANSPDFGASHNCGSDSVLGPQDKDSKARECVKLPPSLSTALQAENVTHKSVPENCPRFNATDGCVSLTNPEACLWTWLAKKCDGSPSGEIQWQACDSQSDVNTKCDTWEYVFKKAHPEINCIARYHCTSPNFNCLALRAQYLVKPSSWNTFSADNSDFVNAFRHVLVDWSGIDQSHVTVHMSEAGSSHPSRTALATLCLRNMPLEYKPEPNVTGSSQLLAAVRQSDLYNQSNGIESLTVLPDELEYLSTTDLNNEPWRCDPSLGVD
ncbi:hypothetical protein AK812_SmicGene39139 [Symbiodinium microadriaticum]|uniref:Uncharacterized protein n=1 Tax=Symbiodinium microadriaticum TaxID=2951 RepID=A0A1Q9CBZ9_SYMMI|nr:hypothetical protein AK812_SmicGene39139 [Symbiodinium microadriaticum]